MWLLLSAVALTVIETLPEGRVKKAVSSLVTMVILIIIIFAGALIIFLLVIVPGHPATSSVYVG